MITPLSPGAERLLARLNQRLRFGVSPCSGCETGRPSPPCAWRSATTLRPRFAPLRVLLAT